MKTSTKKLAVAAMITALSVVLMFIGSATQVLDLSAAAIGSILITYAYIELKKYWPWIIYLAVSLLSFLLLPDKFGALVYFAFAGYYPMFKAIIEKKTRQAKYRVLEWVLKILFFNIILTGILLVSRYILMIPSSELPITILAYILCNLAFVLFDIALTRMITFYIVKLSKKFHIK